MFSAEGAIIRTPATQWEIVEVEFDDPRQGELQVRLVASGLCHSDAHLVTGDGKASYYPMLGGHEGAGIVERVGPHTQGWDVGDHVVFSFIPLCGRCRWCASGMQNLCDAGARLLKGSRADGSYRAKVDGQSLAQLLSLGVFCDRVVVDAISAVKVDSAVPLDRAVLVGCGVATGWGSVVNVAHVEPGQTVIILGCGGIGANAIQGAVMAGATHVIAIDPVPFKLAVAAELGATDTYLDIAEAIEFARSVTNGQGADAAIVTVGVLKTEHIAAAFSSIRKAGIVVVVGLGNEKTSRVDISATELITYHKRIQGALYGGCNPTRDIPRLLQMYKDGKLQLDPLVTATYPLSDINKGYADMHAGKNIRGIIVYE